MAALWPRLLLCLAIFKGARVPTGANEVPTPWGVRENDAPVQSCQGKGENDYSQH